MIPAWRLALFTTLAGTAQGLAVTLALAELGSLPMRTGFLSDALALALLLLLAALLPWAVQRIAPRPGWRALRHWHAAWLMREALLLPTLMAACALWWLALRQGWDLPWLPLAALLAAAALWLSTAMVFAAARPMRAWSQPLTLAAFVLSGLSSGMVLACALAAWQQQQALLQAAGPIALLLTIAAALARLAALRRAPAQAQPAVFFLLLALGLPALLLAAGLAVEATWPWALALALQWPVLLADRWAFIATARPAAA